MAFLSDQTINWKQPGDAGHRRETGGWFPGWGNRSEQHLPYGGESSLNRQNALRKKNTTHGNHLCLSNIHHSFEVFKYFSLFFLINLHFDSALKGEGNGEKMKERKKNIYIG